MWGSLKQGVSTHRPPSQILGEFNCQRISFSFVLSAARGHKRMLLPCLSFLFFFFFKLQVKLSRLKNKQKYREGWETLFHLPFLFFCRRPLFIFSFQQKSKFPTTATREHDYKNLLFLKEKVGPKEREARLWAPLAQVWPVFPGPCTISSRALFEGNVDTG